MERTEHIRLVGLGCEEFALLEEGFRPVPIQELSENRGGGVSCTGWGEAIMKISLAYHMIESLRRGRASQEAAEEGILVLEKQVRGLGGLICRDHQSEIGIAFNTPRKVRAWIQEDMSVPKVAIA